MIRPVDLPIFLAVFAFGCGSPRSAGRPFAFQSDSFAFANELRWQYEFSANGEVETRKNEPPPDYSLRCFPMTRAAREFFYHAEFRPDLPEVSREEYQKLVRQVIHRNSRSPSKSEDRIIIPGFRDLHTFSAAYGEVIKSQCGGPLLSFFQRGNWRMPFPATGRGRAKTADRFVHQLQRGQLPIAHVYQFPNTTLNHALLLYSAETEADDIVFLAYDPNNPERPARLTFKTASNSFLLERNPYFAGGPVRVYEVYRGVFY